MKHLILFFLTLFVGTGLQAGNSRSLDWYRPSTAVPDFEGSFHPQDQLLPVFFESQEPDVKASSYQVRLAFPMYQKLTSVEIKALKSVLDQLADSIVVQVNMGTARKKTVLDLSFCPIVHRNGGYYKLVSFDWDVRPVQQVGLRSAQALSYADHSVLSSGKWRKIKTPGKFF
jgi:hypothetical protein